MRKERVKSYEQYGISKDRYMQLKFLTRQYDEMLRTEAALRRGEYDRAEKGNKGWHRPDPTGGEAMARIARSKQTQITAIEESAKAAAGDRALYLYLMRCVTRGETWEDMSPPIGRAQFYRMRRRFFIELDSRVN